MTVRKLIIGMSAPFVAAFVVDANGQLGDKPVQYGEDVKVRPASLQASGPVSVATQGASN